MWRTPRVGGVRGKQTGIEGAGSAEVHGGVQVDAVAMVIDGERLIADVARSLGLESSRRWVAGFAKPGLIGASGPG